MKKTKSVLKKKTTNERKKNNDSNTVKRSSGFMGYRERFIDLSLYSFQAEESMRETIHRNGRLRGIVF